MGIPSEMRDAWVSKRRTSCPLPPFVIAASPNEQRIADSKNSTREAALNGFKTASITGAVVAVPTLVGCRVIPWAKANLNYTAQALIISAASIAGFFITADKTILQSARGNTIDGDVDISPVRMNLLMFDGDVSYKSKGSTRI